MSKLNKPDRFKTTRLIDAQSIVSQLDTLCDGEFTVKDKKVYVKIVGKIHYDMFFETELWKVWKSGQKQTSKNKLQFERKADSQYEPKKNIHVISDGKFSVYLGTTDVAIRGGVLYNFAKHSVQWTVWSEEERSRRN